MTFHLGDCVTTPPAAIDSLEPRTHLAFSQHSDTFFIHGTDDPDRIEVIMGRSSAGAIVTQIYVGDELHDISPMLKAGRLRKLIVRSGKGDDYVRINTNGVLQTMVRGGDGDDTIESGFGVARLYAGRGDDHLYQHNMKSNDSQGRVTLNDHPGFASGGAGNDTIEGSKGPDLLRGGAGDDSIFGNDEGPDTLLGGSGGDLLDCSGRRGCLAVGGSDRDTLIGSPGPDRLVGRSGNDYLHGAEGNDALIAGFGRDRVFGGTGDDLLLGDDGTLGDYLDGGPGRDRATLDQSCLPGREQLFDALLGIERGFCGPGPM